MFGSSKEIAVAIPLEVWQDPQGNPLLINSERSCEIFVGCWEEDGTPANYICRIEFNSAWASRSYGIEFLPYEIKEHKRSAIFEIENSKWLEDSSNYRLKCYPEWKTWDKKIIITPLFKVMMNLLKFWRKVTTKKRFYLVKQKDFCLQLTSNILINNYHFKCLKISPSSVRDFSV